MEDKAGVLASGHCFSWAGAAHGAGNQALNRGAKLGRSMCLTHGPSQCAGVLARASCAVVWGKTIAVHKIKLRQFSIYFSFWGYITLQSLTIFHLLFLYMKYDFCPLLSRCFVPSGSSRMLFSQ